MSSLKELYEKVIKKGEEGTFTGAQQKTLRYGIYNAENERSAILFLNGRSEYFHKYFIFYSFLNDHGISVYTFDHRGQGFSEKLINDPHKGYVERFSYYIDDVKQFVDEKMNKYKDKGISIVAHSMGGAIATQFALQYPSYCKSLTFSAPMFRINTGAYPEMLSLWIAWLFKSIGLDDLYVPGSEYHGYNPDMPFEENRTVSCRETFDIGGEIVKKYPEIAIAGPTYNWLYEALKATRHIRSHINEIFIPILLMQGGKEKVVDNRGHSVALEICENITFLRFDDSMHEILFEKEHIRHKAYQEILIFLEKHNH